MNNRKDYLAKKMTILFFITVASFFPASYLLFGIEASWLTVPILICIILWFAFMFSYLDIVNKEYKSVNNGGNNE